MDENICTKCRHCLNCLCGDYCGDDFEDCLIKQIPEKGITQLIFRKAKEE